MIKITQAVYRSDQEIKLHFSDGSYGVMDFSETLAQKTSLTLALDDTVFFNDSLSSWEHCAGRIVWNSVQEAFVRSWKQQANW